MPPLHSRYQHVTAEIARLTAHHQRPANAVTLIAVSKQQAVAKVVEVARLGQLDLAENYLQEGVAKIAQARQHLADATGSTEIGDSLCWHFIGHIQSRKCRPIAQHFDWVHTVDSVKVATKLNQYRQGAPLNVLIQLNLQGEEGKSGVGSEELPALAAAVAALPNLRLRGLMMIPQMASDPDKQTTVFRRCRQLRDGLNSQGFELEHLSMGMTADMEAAIAEGATMVRIGTAIFGARPPKS